MQTRHRTPAYPPDHTNDPIGGDNYRLRAITFDLSTLLSLVTTILNTPIEEAQTDEDERASARDIVWNAFADFSASIPTLFTITSTSTEAMQPEWQGEAAAEQEEQEADADSLPLSSLLSNIFAPNYGGNLPLQMTNLSYFDRWWIVQLSELYRLTGFFELYCSSTYSVLIGFCNRWKAVVSISRFRFKTLWPAGFGTFILVVWVWNAMRTQQISPIDLNLQTLFVLSTAILVRTLISLGVGCMHACLAPSYATHRVFPDLQLRDSASRTMQAGSVKIRLVKTEHEDGEQNSALRPYIDAFGLAALHTEIIWAFSTFFSVMSASDVTAWACGLVLYRAFPLLLANQYRAQRPTLLDNVSTNRENDSVVALFWKRILPQLAIVYLFDRFVTNAFFPNYSLVYATLATFVEFLLLREVSSIAK